MGFTCLFDDQAENILGEVQKVFGLGRSGIPLGVFALEVLRYWVVVHDVAGVVLVYLGDVPGIAAEVGVDVGATKVVLEWLIRVCVRVLGSVVVVVIAVGIGVIVVGFVGGSVVKAIVKAVRLVVGLLGVWVTAVLVVVVVVLVVAHCDSSRVGPPPLLGSAPIAIADGALVLSSPVRSLVFGFDLDLDFEFRLQQDGTGLLLVLILILILILILVLMLAVARFEVRGSPWGLELDPEVSVSTCPSL